jgi:hypothetical protein
MPMLRISSSPGLTYTHSKKLISPWQCDPYTDSVSTKLAESKTTILSLDCWGVLLLF